MKFSKKDGKTSRYILLFIINTIIIFLLNSKELYVYLIFVLTTYIGLKYIVKTKTSFYDMLIIVLMLMIKLFLEMLTIGVLFAILKNAYVLSTIAGVIKIVLLIAFKSKMHNHYLNLKKIWDNNNFNLRYIFSLALFLYTIISSMFLIF